MKSLKAGRAMEWLLFLASILFYLSAGGLFLLSGCAAKKKLSAKVVLERQCITKVELTDHTRCTGADGEPLHCTGLTLTRVKGCETLQVNQKEKK